MLLNIPTAIWFGFLTFTSLFTTASLGVAVFYFRKNVFNYHRFFALITVSLALIHLTLAILLWFFGVLI
ncbi:MAG: hypothetical protein PHF86_11585 [Candidatus Nanoarchaeia archaeon]|nr:hypothetical protein [Candidatus Nanoarchaeia archaeon]